MQPRQFRGLFTLMLHRSYPLLLLIHPAWPLVDGALFVSKRRSPAPDGLLTFVRPLCRPGEDPKPQALQSSTGFVVGDVGLLSMLS